MSTPHRAVQDLLAQLHEVPDDPGTLGSDEATAALIRAAASMPYADELVRTVVRVEVNEVYDVTVVLPASAHPAQIAAEAVAVWGASDPESRVPVDRSVQAWEPEP